jgi:peroxiredoxin Q/BCP
VVLSGVVMAVVAGCLAGGRASAVELKVGDPAPRFKLPATPKGELSLESRRGHWTVLYFYPKDDTPGCTTQACAFRDAIAPLRKQDCEVYGISTDSLDSHRAFAAKHSLPFALLADTESVVAKLYGAAGFGGLDKRWTFLIDPALKIRWIERDVDPAVNAEQVLEQLVKWSKAPAPAKR